MSLRSLVKCASFVSFRTATASMSDFAHLATRYANTASNVWVSISELVAGEKPVNLGQGYPDDPFDDAVVETLKKVCNGTSPDLYQYSNFFGRPSLRCALAKLYSPLLFHDIEPMSDILVTVGADQSLFCAILSFVNPGDEVFIIQPSYDMYTTATLAAGGVPVCVPLRAAKKEDLRSSADLCLDFEEIESKITEKTKVFVLNTPNNPSGKVYSREELQKIADLAKKHDLLILADEVYEWFIYPGQEHVKIATLPGMWERTITVGSAGKSFGVTGWKIGWSIGPESLISCMKVAHNLMVSSVATPLQEAVALLIEAEVARSADASCGLRALGAALLPKRDLLMQKLAAAGIPPVVPQGGFFLLADISGVDPKMIEDGSDDSFDLKFNRWMIKQKKLAAIPPSIFYIKEYKHLGEKFIRFCFCKSEETLSNASKIFDSWHKQSPDSDF